jgi:hypothetical protein
MRCRTIPASSSRSSISALARRPGAAEMVRAKLRIVVQDAAGNAADGSTKPAATLKLYQPGTGAASGTATSGTAFLPPLYDDATGGRLGPRRSRPTCAA